MLTYISIIVTAIFINNIVFSQFLGICPFLGVSKKTSSALGMGAAVTFVITLATVVTWLLQRFVLDPLELGYLQTIAFILVIAFLVQMLEIIMKKIIIVVVATIGAMIMCFGCFCIGADQMSNIMCDEFENMIVDECAVFENNDGSEWIVQRIS